ncbi:MFS transporter [Streptomyces sp. NBC_01261]|uniref:MFS transporter n=1 Tax=Streptomyces sp. NBC_01261 TaxID=2903802 RepID=UPI002E2FC3CE|nr:MFS transporter [Streptomyces sp. NBC_01261]
MSPTRPSPDPLLVDKPPRPTKISLREYLSDLRHYPAAAWKAAVACVLAMILSPVALGTTVTFIVEPMSSDFGWSQSKTLTAFSIPTIMAPFALPFAGRCVDRWGARVIAIPGVAVYALGTGAVGIVGPSTVQLVLALLVANLAGYIAILGVVYKVVSQWFPRHRASGYSLLIGVASSLGGAVLSPLSQLSIDGIGWRATYMVLGASVLLIVFPAQVFLLTEPKRAAQTAENQPGPSLPLAPEAAGMPLGKALRTRAWLLMVVILTLSAGVAMSVRLNAVSLFDERGYSATTVSLSVSVLLVASIVGQFLAGFTLDRSTSARDFVPYSVCLLVGTVSIFVANGSVWPLYFSMALLGLMTGAESTVGPYLVARYFGLRAFAQLQGLSLGIVIFVGIGLLPILTQASAERTGGYGTALVVASLAGALTLSLLFLLPRYPADGDVADTGEQQPDRALTTG